MYWVHKHQVAMEYGGPEEGDWWFDTGEPIKSIGPIPIEELAYKLARFLNGKEHKRREREEDYDYTSVLAHQSTHYSYSVESYRVPVAYPKVRPHYE